MNVWIVFCGYNHEGEDVISVHASEAGAEKAIEAQRQERLKRSVGPDYFRIDDFEVCE